jgi:hypothetical protein
MGKNNMADPTGIAEYINTALGTAAVAGAAFAAKWIRDRVHAYFDYLEAKIARWNSKPATKEDRSREIAAGLKVLRIRAPKCHPWGRCQQGRHSQGRL